MDCEFLEILPKFIRVKTPKLKVYDAIHSDIRTTVLRKQVALLSKELHTKRIILQSKKKNFQQTLSCLEYYSLISKRMKLHWPYKQMSFIFLKVLVIRTKPILVKQKDIWQLGLGSIFREIHPFFNIYLPVAHAIILPLRIFIFCHMVTMILIIK